METSMSSHLPFANYTPLLQTIAMRYLLYMILSVVILALHSCASSRSSQSSVRDSISSSSKSHSSSSRQPVTSSEPYVASKVLVQSISNQPLSSKAVRISAAAENAMSIHTRKSSNEKDLLIALASARIGGANTTEMLQYASELMRIRIQQSKKDLPDFAKLEIGLAAIQDKNLARAKIFMDPLIKSTKNPLILASIYNGYGIAALQVGQKTDAAKFFQKSLSSLSSFEPALFNLGFLALEYGHYQSAERYLSSIKNDWYAQLGLVTAYRHTKRNNQAKTLCAQLTKKHQKNKIILFNCGLFYFQNLSSKKQARSLIEKATQESGGLPHWDETAFKVMEKLQ